MFLTKVNLIEFRCCVATSISRISVYRIEKAISDANNEATEAEGETHPWKNSAGRNKKKDSFLVLLSVCWSVACVLPSLEMGASSHPLSGKIYWQTQSYYYILHVWQCAAGEEEEWRKSFVWKGQSSKQKAESRIGGNNLRIVEKRKLEITLRRLDDMNSTGPLLGTYHFIGGREVHILCSGDLYSRLGHRICVAKLGN